MKLFEYNSDEVTYSCLWLNNFSCASDCYFVEGVWMIIYMVMKQSRRNSDVRFVHAVWATNAQANEVAKRCNERDDMNSYYVDGTHELQNDLG